MKDCVVAMGNIIFLKVYSVLANDIRITRQSQKNKSRHRPYFFFTENYFKMDHRTKCKHKTIRLL